MAQEKGKLSINSENFLPIIKKWLYTDKDIFVRELVSNGCDAVTKFKKLVSLGEAEADENEKYAVTVDVNQKEKTITVSDNGIGMTADEIKKYINQIAFSGATDFMEKFKDKAENENDIIGHFGLGFYSAFMVADKVEIDTLSYQPGAESAKWISDGNIEFEITDGTRTERGTTITLYVGDDGKEFLEYSLMYDTLRKYCSFMPVEIFFNFEREKTEEEIKKEAEEEAKKAVEGTEENAEEKKEEKPAETKPEVQAAPKKAPEKKKAPAKKNGVGKPATSRTVRVDIEKLDALMNQVSELIIAKNSLVSISSTEEGGFTNQGFHEQIEYLERITTSLHESVMKVRMVPIESVVNKFPRMIRDLSRTLNKKMELVMTGEDTELDRTVVDQIGDPLQHLLRNSADHGLEDTELRIQRGKPEVGNIFLNAYQEGNNVIIQVGDDGNGIDTEAVKAKAIERNIITPEQAEVMTQKEIINLLFMPSFSMAKKITDISGRGVGLDVVKSNIEQLGGDVEVKTKLGEGTTFTVRLPLTLAIIQALMVEVRDEKYAIALGSIANIESVPVSSIKYVEAKEVIHLRGSVIPLVRLDKLLDIEPREEEPESLTVVIVKKGDSQVGLVVDDLMGQQEIVIKSLGKYINGNKLISGATILGDGEVALILDANTLM